MDVILGVSVPLRGYGFEIIIDAPVSADRKNVSVPLRGYGFEISWEYGYAR